jgi:hypothetical protein
MIGRRYSMLVVLKRLEKDESGHYVYLCRCDCGQPHRMRQTNLKRGRRQSCGCAKSAWASADNAGYTDEERPLVRILRGMEQRCHNPKNKNYANYGGRGIEVCTEWRQDPKAFIQHIGPRPSPQHTVDRKDNSKGYEPGNVRWALPTEQGRNTRLNRPITARGETLLLIEWAERTGLSAQTIFERLKMGWTEEAAVTVPKDRSERFLRPRSNDRLITALGQTKRLTEWARSLGVKDRTLHGRLARGWPPDVAVTAPPGARLSDYAPSFDGSFEHELPQEEADFETDGEAAHG